jgi:hypothetical protein
MRFHAAGTLLMVAALAACAKKEAAVDTTQATSATAMAPTAFTVMDIDMGRHIDAEKKISDKTDDFAPADTIYASVHTTGAAANKAISAKWVFQDGQTVDEHSTTISPTGDAFTEFHIVKPSGWPKGKYTIHVMIDGAEVRTKDVTVK